MGPISFACGALTWAMEPIELPYPKCATAPALFHPTFVLPTGPVLGSAVVGWTPTLDGPMALLLLHSLDGDVAMAGVFGQVLTISTLEKTQRTAGTMELLLLQISDLHAAMLLIDTPWKEAERS